MEVQIVELRLDEDASDEIPTEALLALAFALAPEATMEAMRRKLEAPHWHKCGFGGIGRAEIEHPGCGHLWKHENVPEQHYAAGHICPACKLGPWFIKFAKEDGTLILPAE